MEPFVSMESPHENWCLEKRRAGKIAHYSNEFKTYLCNHVYVIYSKEGKMNWTCLDRGVKPKICCCECSKQESCLTATWYQYWNNHCYICDKQIAIIYNK